MNMCTKMLLDYDSVFSWSLFCTEVAVKCQVLQQQPSFLNNVTLFYSAFLFLTKNILNEFLKQIVAWKLSETVSHPCWRRVVSCERSRCRPVVYCERNTELNTPDQTTASRVVWTAQQLHEIHVVWTRHKDSRSLCSTVSNRTNIIVHG